jgi:uncharacterized protein
MNRHLFLRASTLGLAAMALGGRTWAAGNNDKHRVGAAWRRVVAGTSAAQDFVGVLVLDWDKQKVHVQTEHTVPSRAHGVLAESSGGFLVVAARPGTWLRRLSADGDVLQHIDIQNDQSVSSMAYRTLAGHIMASADRQWLYTPETNQATGEGWVTVRDVRTLTKQAEWRTHGRDPHQCLTDASGALMVANGGIPRTADGKKTDLDRMNASLVRLDGQTGELLGQWQLSDQRLSLRHMAWSGGDFADVKNTANHILLGIALQAEHDDAVQRFAAPVLAVWDGTKLTVPTRDMGAGGYAGDIAAGPGGGFVLSGQRVGKGVLWHPDAPEQLFSIAELKEVCALAVAAPYAQSGVLLGSERGVAHWHPRSMPRMLPWPIAMTVDNHWVVLS